MNAPDEPISVFDERGLTLPGAIIRRILLLVTGVAAVAVVIAHRETPVLAGLLGAVVVTFGVLAIVDVAEQRLPNRITLPLAALTAVVVIIGAIVRSDIGAGLGAIGVGVGYAFILLVLRFGMGDVKLALSIGTIAAWLGTDTLVVTLFAGALAGGVAAVALLIVHRRRGIYFPYGPFMMIGSVAGMLAAGSF